MKRKKVGIIGSTGMVGQRFVKMLEDHPYFEVVMVSSSERSAGNKYGEYVNWSVGGEMPDHVKEMELKNTDVKCISEERPDLIFSALPSEVAGKMEKELASEGIHVFSNARPNRMDDKVPILIPEINHEHLDIVQHQGYGGIIVTNSNCTASGLTLGVSPLLDLGVRSIDVVTYQALSGAGLTGVPSLAILGNVIPFIRNEEEAMEAETKKILGRLEGDRICDLEAAVNASCARVPVVYGHLENVTVEFHEDVNTDVVIDAWKSFKGEPQRLELPTAPEIPVRYMEQEDRPQPTVDIDAGRPERAAGMTVSVGRSRKKEGNKINFWLLVHNTVRGAAGASVLNAEYAFKSKVI